MRLRALGPARRAEDRLEPSLLEPARTPMTELARRCGESVLLTAPAGTRVSTRTAGKVSGQTGSPPPTPTPSAPPPNATPSPTAT